LSDHTPITLAPVSSQIDTTLTIPSLDASQCSTNLDVYANASTNAPITGLSQLFPDTAAVVSSYLKLPTPLLLINSRYWQNAIEIIEEVIPSTIAAKYLLSYNRESLFGRVSVGSDQQINFVNGQLAHSDNNLLVLNISPLLVEPSLWFMLKSVLQRGYLLASDAVNAEKIKQELPDLSSYILNPKIVLVASRIQLEELIQIDPEYTQVSSLFCELASQVPVNQTSVNAVVTYCNNICKEKNIPLLESKAISTLLTFLIAQCQHQQQILFSPELIKDILQYALLFSDSKQIDSTGLIACFTQRELAQSLPRRYSEQSLVEGQINLQLTGEKIGQINGLSVVELLGYPCEFGEVFRISASDMIGDGEIIDVERKVELAGNVHAKSTLIVQGYINHLFSHINAFPFSCNLVFEQSYQESDGDSASLAILLAVCSCYAKLPVKQNVFITGSLDQHGNVLAIGGINQKIESVTRLFELKLISEPVYIVMPAANKINLTLNASTLALIESGKILIHPIDHCHQAFPILLDNSFGQTIKIINNRIEKMLKEEMNEQSNGVFSRIIHSIFH